MSHGYGTDRQTDRPDHRNINHRYAILYYKVFGPDGQQRRLMPRNLAVGQQANSAQLCKLECGPMPNLMVALPNVAGALCSTPQSLADAYY